MISKNELKYLASLQQKKIRSAQRKFIAEGKRIVEMGLSSHFFCELILVTDSFLNRNSGFLDGVNNTIRIEVLKEKDFLKISETKNPQGIAAVFNILKKDAFVPLNQSIIIILDNISDPGNLGTIFRNCDWFGIKDIILSKDSVEPYNPKVLRSSMGSIFHLNIFETEDLISFIGKLKAKEYQIVCADMIGKNMFDFKLSDKTAIIFSNEAFGPTENILQTADVIITIPKKGEAESLNVASASAIILAYLTNT